MDCILLVARFPPHPSVKGAFPQCGSTKVNRGHIPGLFLGWALEITPNFGIVKYLHGKQAILEVCVLRQERMLSCATTRIW